jgi:hypothetical protein
MAGDLSGGPQTVKRREKGRNWALKTGKAELCGPASLCDVEPHARSGRSVGLARPFGLWITRSAPWSPMKRRRDPTTVLILRRVATTWLRPWPGRNQSAEGFVAQRTPATPPHGIAARPPDRGTLRLLTPPPSAAHGNGRPRACLPREFSDCFPEPPDFSADAFHNRSAHKQSIHERLRSASGKGGLIPAIHRRPAAERRREPRV